MSYSSNPYADFFSAAFLWRREVWRPEGFPRLRPGSISNICRNAEFVVQLADHIEGQRPLAPQYLVDPSAPADYSDFPVPD